jgi:hypothetical protein
MDLAGSLSLPVESRLHSHDTHDHAHRLAR